jgi:hypothetical protein
MSHRLQVGIDFSQNCADLCLLFPDGDVFDQHQSFANSPSGFLSAKHLLLDALESGSFDGLDVAGEATGFLWLPFFLSLFQDPDLFSHDPNLYLLNPRWVHWYKKCFSEDNKTDQKDPFYIADRMRTHKSKTSWSPQWKTLPLRFYTRARFHLVQNLAREKCYFSSFLFLKASAYRRIKPFSNLFGRTSRLVLDQHPTLDQLATIPVADLASQLYHISGHHLPDPLKNARKLHQVVTESFTLPEAISHSVQQVLSFTLDHIRFLEHQVEQMDKLIENEVQLCPAVSKLATIPGVGPVYSSGIGAEIGDVNRFLRGNKWDNKRKRHRPKNLRDAEDAVAKIAGLWWPKRASGSFQAQDRRMAKSGNRYLRYYLIQAANKMRQSIPDYQAFYQRKYREASKHHHKRALVLTARKGVGLFVGLLHRNEVYRAKEL